MRKARFITAIRGNQFDRHSWEHTELVYEYRGYQYIVTRHNNGYSCDSLPEQHRKEQERIDEMIERKRKPIPEWKYEGSAQEAFDWSWEEFEKI